jgi:hypothetical protein
MSGVFRSRSSRYLPSILVGFVVAWGLDLPDRCPGRAALVSETTRSIGALPRLILVAGRSPPEVLNDLDESDHDQDDRPHSGELESSRVKVVQQ